MPDKIITRNHGKQLAVPNIMRVYEAEIRYNLIRLGEDVILDSADKVPAYLESSYAVNPTVEHFVVVLLDRKNHPLGKITISSGTLTSSVVI